MEYFSNGIFGSGNSFGGSVITGGNCTITGGTVKGIIIKGDGTYIIDGKEYKSDEVSVRTEYKIKSTGKAVYTEPQHIQLKLQGDNISASVCSSSGDIEIESSSSTHPCIFKSIKSSSGDITIEGNAEKVTTSSGDVSVKGSINGPVNTNSGNIRSKNR
jgi:hypothetical protein